MSTENPTPYWIRACTSTVPATSSPPVTPDAMRPEYDIRGGVRGKYARRYHRHPPKGEGARAMSEPERMLNLTHLALLKAEAQRWPKPRSGWKAAWRRFRRWFR